MHATSHSVPPTAIGEEKGNRLVSKTEKEFQMNNIFQEQEWKRKVEKIKQILTFSGLH